MIYILHIHNSFDIFLELLKMPVLYLSVVQEQVKECEGQAKDTSATIFSTLNEPIFVGFALHKNLIKCIAICP